MVAALVGACRSAPERSRAVPRLGAWSDGQVKKRILAFVDTVSDPTKDAYVPPARRIAVFDLDGTLIIERPLYLEVLVAIRTLRAAAIADPSLGEREPYRAVLAGDLDYIGQHGAEIVTAAADGESAPSLAAPPPVDGEIAPETTPAPMINQELPPDSGGGIGPLTNSIPADTASPEIAETSAPNEVRSALDWAQLAAGIVTALLAVAVVGLTWSSARRPV